MKTLLSHLEYLVQFVLTGLKKKAGEACENVKK
jgi:hypothetical protein